MSRAIRLSRIHAINWYGYNDALPVEGNLLLAGITGSGKSVLMDLVMTVLVGTEVAHRHFNRSATGGQSDRTLKSYCLLDTKREEDGVPQYQRNKGAITYVALEFTWPVSPGTSARVETWGLRLEFRSTAENDCHPRAFFCPMALKKSDFLDSDRRPLELADFTRAITRQYDGVMFETQKQYLRDMANDQHLNFNRSVLESLLPQAMSFTNRKSFDNFIRDFVLPGEQLDVGDVVGSYRSYRAFERDLTQLRDQLERLQAIRSLHRSCADAKRDRVVARWLGAEFAQAHAQRLAEEWTARLQVEQEALAADDERLARVTEAIAVGTAEVEQLRNVIRATPDGELYLFIKQQNRKLVREIEDLSAVGTRVDDALRNRVQKAKQWLGEVIAARLPGAPATGALQETIQRLEACEAAGSEAALAGVSEAAEQLKQGLSRAVRPAREELEQVRRKLGTLREEIRALELGLPPGPNIVLAAINDSLPREGRDLPAQPLCRLCEVVDEKWRPAIEVAFTRKFAVVVSQQNYEAALKVYHAVRGDSPMESLVHPAKASRLDRPVRPGSLAERIRADHPVARAIVSHMFGNMMCVERPEELADHEQAILRDGFMARGAFVERRRHYDNLPFVGLRGLEKQLEMKRGQCIDLEARERQLLPVLQTGQLLVERGTELIPDHNSLIRDLIEATRLPHLQKELSDNIAKLNSIDRDSFEEKERRVDMREGEIRVLGQERDSLLLSPRRAAVSTLKKALASAEGEVHKATEVFDQVRAEIGDISIHTVRLTQWRDEITTRLPALDVAANEFRRLQHEADKQEDRDWARLTAARRELALVHRKFTDLVDTNPDNEPWNRLLSQVEEANIPDFEQKAKAELARWENLFRTQVLQKLDQALRRLRDLVVLLNDTLRKQPIGSDLYEIEARPNPEFRHLRELVSLNAQHQRDELFYAAVDQQMRETLDDFLELLVEKPDSLEAARLLDYRHFFDYRLLVSDPTRPGQAPIDVDRQSGKMSGGENQSPYFVVILASYLRAYRRHETRWRDPSLALVPIDEAFSKMDTGRIKNCIEAIKALDLQGLFSMSTGNVPGAFGLCDQLIMVARHPETRGGREHLRNIPVTFLRDSDAGHEWMREHS